MNTDSCWTRTIHTCCQVLSVQVVSERHAKETSLLGCTVHIHNEWIPYPPLPWALLYIIWSGSFIFRGRKMDEGGGVLQNLKKISNGYARCRNLMRPNYNIPSYLTVFPHECLSSSFYLFTFPIKIEYNGYFLLSAKWGLFVKSENNKK